MTFTASSTEAGNVELVLNGTSVYIPITAGAVGDQAAEVNAWINANSEDYTSTVSLGVVTITSKYKREEVNLAFDANGVAGTAATAFRCTNH